MTRQQHGRKMPVDFAFEGDDDEARGWLDQAYGASLRLSRRLGTVRHNRRVHGSLGFDYVQIDTRFAFDSDPMPALVIVDVLGGTLEYSRNGITDLSRDGDSVLVAGWDMPFSGRSDSYAVRATTVGPELLASVVEDFSPDHPGHEVRFISYVPRSPAAGARWRATIDGLSVSFPGEDAPLARGAASRLLGQVLLQTFPNSVVDGEHRLVVARDHRDAGVSTVGRATRFIEQHAHEDLSLAAIARHGGVSPRALQYGFRRHLGCTPLAFLRRVRLDLARQALRNGSSTSVSDVAVRFGFFNPGRFATAYRDVFGEQPGRTIQRYS